MVFGLSLGFTFGCPVTVMMMLSLCFPSSSSRKVSAGRCWKLGRGNLDAGRLMLGSWLLGLRGFFGKVILSGITGIRSGTASLSGITGNISGIKSLSGIMEFTSWFTRIPFGSLCCIRESLCGTGILSGITGSLSGRKLPTSGRKGWVFSRSVLACSGDSLKVEAGRLGKLANWPGAGLWGWGLSLWGWRLAICGWGLNLWV